MAKLGSIELTADQDVDKGKETSISPLFAQSERGKEFELLEDVKRDETNIKVTVTKVGSFETKADATRKKGEKTSYNALLKYQDYIKKLVVSESIKKGDQLEVTFETLEPGP